MASAKKLPPKTADIAKALLERRLTTVMPRGRVGASFVALGKKQEAPPLDDGIQVYRLGLLYRLFLITTIASFTFGREIYHYILSKYAYIYYFFISQCYRPRPFHIF